MPLFDDYLNIICAYNYTEHLEPQDLINAYLEFDWSYYLALTVSLVGFIIAWKFCESIASKLSDRVKNELERSRLPPWWIMICAVLDQDQFPKISRAAFTILSLCFSFFFFITIDCFMLNVMSSDLVTIENPRVVQSYRDILEREDLKVLFVVGLDEETLFQNAEKGSDEFEIWKKRFELRDLSVNSIASVWQPIIDQKMIGLMRDWLGRGAANLGLSKMREIGVQYIRALETRDETGKMITNSMMIQRQAPKQLKDYMKER